VQLLTLGRRLGVGMNKLMSIGNEQVIDIAEFIACLERRRRCRSCVAQHVGISGAAARRIKEPRDRTKMGVAVIVRCSFWSCRVRC
jgi:hypothetical protein